MGRQVAPSGPMTALMEGTRAKYRLSPRLDRERMVRRVWRGKEMLCKGVHAAHCHSGVATVLSFVPLQTGAGGHLWVGGCVGCGAMGGCRYGNVCVLAAAVNEAASQMHSYGEKPCGNPQR